MSTWRQSYRERNKERINAKKREWYRKNIEKNRLYGRKSYAENPEKELARAKLWRKNNREKWRISQRASQRRKNCFPPELFAVRLAEQNGRCAICSVLLTNGLQSSAANADHCHVTGMARGVLCKRCNSMLGYANDNQSVLLKAVDYLKSFTITPK